MIRAAGALLLAICMGAAASAAPALPQAVSSQAGTGLGDAAAKEKARREKLKKQGVGAKSYDETDLKPPASAAKKPPDSTAASGDTATSASSGQTAASEPSPDAAAEAALREQERQVEEQKWRAEAAQVHGRVLELEEQVQDLEQRQTNLFNAKLITTDGYRFLELSKALEEVSKDLEAARKELLQAREAQERFLDKARSARIPEAWTARPQ